MGAEEEACICAIDQGTQSTRVLLFDYKARVIAKHQAEFEQHVPRAGWVEHDPEEILDSVRTCVDGALAAAEQQGRRVRVKAVGITNQRETTLVWDRATGRPLHNAIVWLDNRTAAICHDFKERHGSADHFRPITGLPISTYFSAYKYRWLLEHAPGVREAVAEGRCLLGTIDTWLIWNLTGGANGGAFVTDVTNASRTSLMDLATLDWHAGLLREFGVAREMLADIRSNCEVYGQVAEGPLAGVPIAGCLGDQQSALLGQACKQGEAKNTYGTGCFLLLNTGPARTQSSHGLLTTVAYQLGAQAEAQFALEGSIAVAGVGVRWLRDNLGLISSPQDSEAVARSVPDTGGVVFVPAFSGLLAPHWRDDARGVLLGLTGYTKAAHVVRALLEAMAWQTRDVLDAMRDDADVGGVRRLKVDGGASNNDLLMQMQADALQLPVRRPGMLETTSLGAAFAAGVGVGFWSADWVLHAALDEHAAGATDFEPACGVAEADARYAKWRKAVRLSFGLADLTDS